MKQRSIFVTGIALFLLIFGCQPSPLPEISKTSSPVLGLRGEGDSLNCVGGASKWFSLKPLVSGSSSFVFELNSSTYPYDLYACLCSVDQYQITFTSLPDSQDITIKDAANEAIQFSIENNQPGNEPTILINCDQLETSPVQIHITFSEKFSTNFSRAGGLCIIDNLGACTDPPDLSAIRLLPSFFLKCDSQVQVIIPAAMTD